jgi:hypothetical protein
MSQLKTELRRMFLEFIQEIEAEKWKGKEREAVSAFAFSKLVKNVGCCPELYDTAQISIEVRVMQVQGRSKKRVCKDMLIWAKPYQTAFSEEEVIPLCIIEWKEGKQRPYDYDMEWLRDYTRAHPSCFGIAVNLENAREYTVKAALVERGEIAQLEWI